jgi:hypothetical protein
MTSYNLDPNVSINAVTYDGDTLNGIKITMGRQSVDEQPRAGYCNVNLITSGANGPNVNLDDPIEIRLKNSSGVYIKIFSGFVSDINRSFRNFGQSNYVVNTNIVGVGNLALLNRRAVGSVNYPKELDGARILKILGEAISETWLEVDPSLEWGDVDPTITWADYDTGIGTIDNGDYEIITYNDGATNAYNLATQVANSARGVLHEKGDGKIYYDDASRRISNVQNNGYIDLAENVILANTSSFERLADLANTITVNYRNNMSVSGTDPTSIANYGVLSATVNTLLHDTAAAETIRDLYLFTRAEPRRTLNQVTIALFVDTMTAGQLDAVVEVYCGMPIQIDNIPNSIYGGAFLGFVEGWVWDISRVEAFLTLYLTEYALSVLAQNWSQVYAGQTYSQLDPIEWGDVDPTVQWFNYFSGEKWNTVSPTLDWANAQVVA